jgi:hypothetical protein
MSTKDYRPQDWEEVYTLQREMTSMNARLDVIEDRLKYLRALARERQAVNGMREGATR